MEHKEDTRSYSKMDFSIIFGSMLLATCLVSIWIPASPGDDDAMIAFRMFSGLASLACIFIVTCVYGIWRFVQKGKRALVAALVALPALYGGLVVGGLRNGSPNNQGVPMSNAIRVQDGLAALWWGRQAATDLPSWSRGGLEVWPTTAGDLSVETTKTRVNVILINEATPRECQRLIGDMSEQRSVLKTIGGWLSVNGEKVPDGGKLMQACKNGGIVSLSAPLPNHE